MRKTKKMEINKNRKMKKWTGKKNMNIHEKIKKQENEKEWKRNDHMKENEKMERNEQHEKSRNMEGGIKRNEKNE